MITNFRASAISLTMSLLISTLIGQSVPKAVKPQAGFIPDQATALRVAEAILIPIYGREQVESERPFSVELSGNTWKVEGHLASGTDGGVADVWLDKRDGRILRVSHGK